VLLLPLLVLALYLTTSFYPLRDGGSLEGIISAGAVGLWLALDRKLVGFAIATAVAVLATSVELALVHLGVFRYLPSSDELFGVAPWLLPLYFAASITAGAVGRRFLAER
jgi:hypothetical protein